MKKNGLFWAAACLSSCVLYSSCIGSFGLFNKFAQWNVDATPYKLVNGILGIVLIPVYGICLTADWIVLNTIEFWTGTPLLASVGETKHVVGTDGNEYVIVTEKDGYHIQNETTGEEVRMVFDDAEKVWSLVRDGDKQKMLRLNGDNTLTMYLPDGEEVTVTCDEKGLEQVRGMAAVQVPFMAVR